MAVHYDICAFIFQLNIKKTTEILVTQLFTHLVVFLQAAAFDKFYTIKKHTRLCNHHCVRLWPSTNFVFCLYRGHVAYSQAIWQGAYTKWSLFICETDTSTRLKMSSVRSPACLYWEFFIVEPLSEADVLASFDKPYMSSASCPLGALLPSNGGHDPQRHGSITQITDRVCYLPATGRSGNKQIPVLPP